MRFKLWPTLNVASLGSINIHRVRNPFYSYNKNPSKVRFRANVRVNVGSKTVLLLDPIVEIIWFTVSMDGCRP